MTRAAISRPLESLARMRGLQVRYRDTSGRPCSPAPEAVLALLRLLGEDIAAPGDAAPRLAALHRHRPARPVPPVVLCRPGTHPVIPLRRPAADSERIAYTLRLDDGSEREGRLAPLPAKPGGGRRTGASPGVLPAGLGAPVPAGLHRLLLHMPRGSASAWLLCSPKRAWRPDAPACGPEWGLFAPPYAAGPAESESVPAGGYSFLERLIDFTADYGGGLTATLPLYPALRDRDPAPSPYAPSSRLFFNDFYINPERLPEFHADGPAARYLESERAGGILKRLHSAPFVDYPGTSKLKDEILARLAPQLPECGPRREAFRSFLRETPGILDYARYCTRRQGSPPTGAGTAAVLYGQFAARSQLSDAYERARSRGVDLYADLPLGVHPEGYDAWKYAPIFAKDASVGAPPDDFFAGGQDWGFNPVAPRAFHEEGLPYYRAVLSRAMRFCDVLRLDHVMGLHRLYWIPKGFPPREGAYVRYPSEILYRLVTLESHRHHTRIVGEDLGTVPRYVRTAMDGHELSRTWVFQFEASPVCGPPSENIPPGALAALNTHDTPPFAAFWTGSDIDERLSLGLLDQGEARRERTNRDAVRRRIGTLLHLPVSAAPESSRDQALAILLRDLMSSGAAWVLINLEDLWGELRRQNWPGIEEERPSWRRKMSRSLRELACDSRIGALLSSLNRARSKRESVS